MDKMELMKIYTKKLNPKYVYGRLQNGFGTMIMEKEKIQDHGKHLKRENG